MEVTLEKIELVKDRTGVSYKEAKEALEAADGSVVDAIISIEEVIDTETQKSVKEEGAAVIDKVKELVKKGNVSKVVVKKNDGEVLLNLPMTAGILGAVVAPWGVLAGVLSTFVFKCVVEVVKDDGTIIDVTDRANEAMGKAVEKGSALKDVAIEKGGDVVEKVKSSDVMDKVMNSDIMEKVKNSDFIDKATDTIKDTTETIKSKFAKVSEEAEEAAEEMAEDIEDVAEEIQEAAEEVKAEVED
ncbi:MAG: DUF4342 domain-containing protein [Firmicutes bacterium]|nr:DUF4342 domain-containing protein [Bacillota bacterium]MBQ3964353.1 DUF4342 domain-containing protein [Bacillota bacterium]